jgi:hypothetical protein
MAALNLANIPNGINSYERLAVWAIQCLQSISNGQQVNVVSGQAQMPLAQAQIAITADNQPRFILSGYLPCDWNTVNSGTVKTWMAAGDIASVAPHTNLLSN